MSGCTTIGSTPPIPTIESMATPQMVKIDADTVASSRDGHVSAEISEAVRSACTTRATAVAAFEGPATKCEVWAWYVYDFSTSPYWQVADVIVKWHLKRLAEYAEAAGGFNVGMSDGSYPAAIMWITSAAQVVCLLSLSAFGDYGHYRKVLLRALTLVGCATLSLFIFCFKGEMWLLAGGLRILVGICFSLCNVYYNAYLPVLASQHPDVLALKGSAAVDREVAVQDELSAKGQAFGYIGGMVTQLVAFGILLVVECNSDCTEFDRLFWFGLCIMLVGLWWGSFSLYTFRHLRERAGPPFPEGGTHILCIGWSQTWRTLCVVWRLRQALFFMIAYFVWSDALTTTINVSVLYMDEKDGGRTGSRDDTDNDSTRMLLLAGSSCNCILGVIASMRFQQLLNISAKTMILGQLSAYAAICTACACGALSALDGTGYYLCMVPVTLLMGSLQAYSRSLYSSLSPAGLEAAMFSLYAITDKGSSLVGAAVIAVVHTSTGSYIGVFWYCVVAFTVSAIVLFSVDVKKGMLASERRDGAKKEGSTPTADGDTIGQTAEQH